MLWRVSKGNVFVRFCDIDEEMVDPKTGEELLKCVFIIFYQGKALTNSVKKICDGFHATVYSCPASKVFFLKEIKEKYFIICLKDERQEMMIGVKTRLDDLKTVIGQTRQHKLTLLKLAAANLRRNYIKIRKMKSVYYILNMFSLREGQRVMIG